MGDCLMEITFIYEILVAQYRIEMLTRTKSYFLK